MQTPTLALIVNRQNAIDNFKPTAFYEVHAVMEPGFTAKYILPGQDETPQTRFHDRAAAQAVLDHITPIPSGSVASVVTTEKMTKPPQLFDLLSLQKECNKRFGYTAQETLDLAQSLYEEYKLLSYPRTESRHLSTDMLSELPDIVATVINSSFITQTVRDAFTIANIRPGNLADGLIQLPLLGKSYVDNTKLTDHHAIIPTHKQAGSDLPAKQRNVYEAVTARFLSIFLPPEVRDETIAFIKIGQHSFRATGMVVKEPGWTLVAPSTVTENEKAGEDNAQKLPPLSQTQIILKNSAQLKEGKTTAPKPYDDSSLLTAMKDAGQEIEDKELASAMKQSGLGTPATRAAIIEKLISVDYIERKKKSLVPTEKGKVLISQVHQSLKDVALTAFWEQQLADIQEGTQQANSFADGIVQFVREVVSQIIAAPPCAIATTDQNSYGPCPKCKEGFVRKTKMGAGCSRFRAGCLFSIWAKVNGKQLTEEHIRQLVTKGRTGLIKGFKKTDGTNTYDACLVLTEDFKVRPDFASHAKAAKHPH